MPPSHHATAPIHQDGTVPSHTVHPGAALGAHPGHAGIQASGERVLPKRVRQRMSFWVRSDVRSEETTQKNTTIRFVGCFCHGWFPNYFGFCVFMFALVS